MTTTGPDYYEKQSAQDSRMAVLETKVQDLEEQLERFKDKDQEELPEGGPVSFADSISRAYELRQPLLHILWPRLQMCISWFWRSAT